MKASPWAARHAGVVEALFACLARARRLRADAHLPLTLTVAARGRLARRAGAKRVCCVCALATTAL
ncbi:hypothetical protein PF011_g1393 [Phytophthora fragariae]|uniref:Uncharacterized protein n=1 Tax=Phytophthora fragariae TaxID=53985 RepID=A0A6A3MH33_9STRA|nr:hypothetical protein PF011_g1393 [Phytophthora fragariae]